MSAPPLTAEEVDELAKTTAGSMFGENTSAAGIIAAVMARRMNQADTREDQEKAGAHVLATFASLARGPS